MQRKVKCLNISTNLKSEIHKEAILTNLMRELKYPYKLIIDKSRIKFKIENIKKNKNKKKYFHRMGCSFDIVSENNLEKLKQ